MKLAIISPVDAYSETFIKAHKQLPFDIQYYSNGFLPATVDGKNLLQQRAFIKAFYYFRRKGFSYHENMLIRSFRNGGINCVMAEYGPTACAILKIVKFAKLPLIVNFYGYDATENITLLKYSAGYKQVFEYAKYVTVVSQQMRNDLLRLGCSPEKIIVNVCGPNDQFYKLEKKETQLKFIAVGRFVDKKAPYYTLAAFKQVLKKNPAVTLTMVGDGPLFNSCINLAKYWNLSGSINFTGILSPDQIMNEFSDSLAFVQHSIKAANGDSEGTPVAILDAQAAGLPVISTKHAGIPDVVVDGKTGLLVEEHDVDGMAEYMMELVGNNTLAEEMGKRGRVHVRENFSMAKHLEKLAGIIKSALDK